jgi:hypothetical protein
MTTERKTEQLLVRLTRATVDGIIKWEFTKAPATLTSGTEDLILSYMETEFKEQRFGAYERRYRWFDTTSEELYWTSSAKLILLDESDEVIWENSKPSLAVNQLFDKAKQNAGRVNDIFTKLLAD